MTNRLMILAVAALFLTSGVVKSQAPATGSIAASLATIVAANKALIDKQQKTLDGLDQLDQAAEQLKAFGKRG